jgi:8-oxo-(d)GTP phosphatase
MKIFVNNVLLNVLKASEASPPGTVFPITHANEVMAIYQQIKEAKPLLREQYNFLPEDYQAVKEALKSRFDVIEAAGGLVVKQGAVLFIKRLGKWDLPKGKLEPGEKKRLAAVREVEEECGVKALVIKKAGVTWHTYLNNHRDTLKKTTWYEMECLDDRRLAPQTAEAITKVKWVPMYQSGKVLSNTYRSIHHIFLKFLSEKTGAASPIVLADGDED